MTHKDFNGYRLTDVEITKINMPDYQRDPEQGGAWAQQIASEWDHHLFRHPYLTPNADGTYDCLDGQNTVLAAALRGHKTIPAFVSNAPVAHPKAASVFSDVNTKRRRLQPYNVWKADRIAGRSWAVLLDTITAKHGLSVARGSGIKNIRCIAQARTIIERDGPELLDAALGVLTQTWDGTAPEHSARAEQALVLGMADLIKRAQAVGKFSQERFVSKLQRKRYTRFGAEVSLTPGSFGESYISHIIETSAIPMPSVVGGGGRTSAYSRAFAVAIFGAAEAKRMYGYA